MPVGARYLDEPTRETAGIAAANGAAFDVAAALEGKKTLWRGAPGLRLVASRSRRVLAHNVTVAAGDDRAAAAALAGGVLRIFGPFACKEAPLPDAAPAQALALAPEGSLLAAWTPHNGLLTFYELNAPGCAATSTTVRGARLDVALSPDGTLLAVHTASGAIRLGARGGALRRIGDVPERLALFTFTRAGGALVAIGTDGKTRVWTPQDDAPLMEATIPGGPFARGFLAGEKARLTRADGTTIVWSLAGRRPAGPEDGLEAPGSAWLELRGGTLSLASERAQWRGALLATLPQPKLEHSPSTGTLRLRDVDGIVRYYAARTGRPTRQTFADDWLAVPLADDGTASVEGRKLRVYDVMDDPADEGEKRLALRALRPDLVYVWKVTATDDNNNFENLSIEQGQGFALPYRIGLAPREDGIINIP